MEKLVYVVMLVLLVVGISAVSGNAGTMTQSVGHGIGYVCEDSNQPAAECQLHNSVINLSDANSPPDAAE